MKNLEYEWCHKIKYRNIFFNQLFIIKKLFLITSIKIKLFKKWKKKKNYLWNSIIRVSQKTLDNKLDKSHSVGGWVDRDLLDTTDSDGVFNSGDLDISLVSPCSSPWVSNNVVV